VEIHKRVGAFAMALQTINKCLSDAICAMARSMLDGESRAAALIHSGNEIMETARYSEARLLSSSVFSQVEH
jgi:nuclear pore complex protein Nup93